MLREWINVSYCVFSVLMSISCFALPYNSTKDDQNSLSLSISLHCELLDVTENHILIVASHQHATFCHEVIGRIDVQSVWRDCLMVYNRGSFRKWFPSSPLVNSLFVVKSARRLGDDTVLIVPVICDIIALNVSSCTLFFFLLSLSLSLSICGCMLCCGCVWELVGFERRH